MTSNNDQFSYWDNLFVRCWAATNLVLIALTWKLWFPEFAEFPRVPVIPLSAAANPLQWVAGIGTLGCLMVLVVVGLKKSICLAIAACFIVLFFCNQHCLQPWAWQAFVFSVLFGFLGPYESKKWTARVVVSIYLYSAIGKFDYQFANTLGVEFLDVLLSWIGREEMLGGVAKSKVALLFPMVELLIAIGLIFRRTQKVFAFFAIALHLSLIAIFSPFGLGHQWPVLVWNGLSILIVMWLFLSFPAGPDQDQKSEQSLGQNMAIGFAILVLLGPLLRPVQLWDHWLAWGLYSPSNSRVELYVADNQLERFRDWEPYVADAIEYPGSSRFAMERWSLAELGVPIYPEARFQKEVALTWLAQRELNRFAKMIELGPSHPLTGRRSQKSISLSNE